MLMDQMEMGLMPESTADNEAVHVPVMLNEVIAYLRPQPGQIFIDGTLGLGGHALSILKLLGGTGRLIGIEQDQFALQSAQEYLVHYRGQCSFVHDNFRNMGRILKELRIDHVDGILLDLGVSSFQLGDPQRGFGFKHNGPLDMRMDPGSVITASNVVNTYSEEEISKILKEFGEERWHQRIARYIVHERSKRPIASTQELSNVVLRAMPRNVRRQKIHPATRTFQALRIAVNRELEAITVVLDQCADFLKVGGRIGVIAFHSLEDRIVKHKFRQLCRAGMVDLIVKKPIRPSEAEVQFNPRARSARLRIAERKAPL